MKNKTPQSAWDREKRNLQRRISQLFEENKKLKQTIEELQATQAETPESAEHPFCSEKYIEAFKEGDVTPMAVPEWGTYVLIRGGQGGQGPKQATGLEPCASLDPGCDLRGGLDRLKHAGVGSLSLITDPLWQPPLEALQETFNLCRPLKLNFIIDRKKGVRIRKRHRNRINKARNQCQVETVRLTDHFETWWQLYESLVSGKQIKESSSRFHFEKLAELDELTTIAVRLDGEITAMTLWVRYRDKLYFHSSACSEKGYEAFATHAAYDEAIKIFEDCRYVNLGATIGFVDSNQGLAEFKRGFSNDTLQNYFCSAILTT